MKNQILKEIYRVVVYLRLSVDDGDSHESDSISNQRLLVHGYLAGKPEFVMVKECVDDGFTGTNFERPGFREMIRLLEDGEADCVIAKDLSRFGRDFSGVLQYVERIFPKMGVRLILLNDSYDSVNSNHDLLTLRLKSFINDIFAGDTSRSVRAILQAKRVAGQCVAPFAIFGYLKSPEDKHKLVVDSAAASVVQDIFQLKLKGHSLSEIASILNARRILTPLEYKNVYLKQKLHTVFRKEGESRWCATMVRRILMDERYTGVMIQGKTTTPNHKVKRLIRKSANEWVRYENAFEPVVDRHIYEVVSNLMERDVRKSLSGVTVVGGLVECADCCQSMIRKSPDGIHHYYVCSTSLYEKECSPHSFSEERLVSVVQESVRYYVTLIAELREVLEHIEKAAIPEQKMYEADQMLRVMKENCERIFKIKKNLYDSFSEGLLDEEEYRTYKKKYDIQLEDAENSVKKQQKAISDMTENLEKQKEWMDIFLNYKETEDFDRMTIAMLVKRVRIHNDKRVSIDFWFSDEFEHLVSLVQAANSVCPNQKFHTFLNKEGGKRHA